MKRLVLWKVKLKALRQEQRQWEKARARAYRALIKLTRQIDELEKKIENELARSQ